MEPVEAEEVEAGVEVATTAVVEDAGVKIISSRVQAPLQPPGGQVPSMLIYQLETGRGAGCTSDTAEELTSVRN